MSLKSILKSMGRAAVKSNPVAETAYQVGKAAITDHDKLTDVVSTSLTASFNTGLDAMLAAARVLADRGQLTVEALEAVAASVRR